MIISVALVFNWHIVMVENNNKGDNKSESSQDIIDNLKEIEELDKEMKERRKKEKERILQGIQKKSERKEYSFKKDPSKIFKRGKLKYFIPGGKGEKQMMKILAKRGIKGIKSKEGEKFVRGLKKFADESVKVPTKPMTLKKITMLNYLRQLKKEKRSFLKKSQVRKIRETFFPGIIQKSIFIRNKESDEGKGKTRKFSVSRRTDKFFDDRGKVGRKR